MGSKKRKQKRKVRNRAKSRKMKQTAGVSMEDQSDTTADEKIQDAFRIHQDGNIDEAISVYRGVLSISPDHPDALHLLGVAMYQKGDLERSEELIRRAIHFNPGVAFFYSNLGNTLKTGGKPQEAVLAYQQALELDADCVDALFNLGVTLHHLARHSEALNFLERVIALKPDHVAAHVFTGAAWRGLGKPEQALLAYQQALQLEPDHVEAICGKAAALKDTGRLEEALELYRKAIRIHPKNPEGFSNLGNLLKDMGKMDDAVAAYRQAVHIRPDFLCARINLANVLNDQGLLDAALSEYRKARRLRPDCPWSAAGEAKVLMKRGDFDGALELIQPLVRSGSENYDVAVAYAQLARRFNHYDEAVALLKRLLQAGPSDVDQLRQIHFSLGGLLDRLGRYDDAFSHFKSANRLRPPRFDPHRHEQSVAALIQVFDSEYWNRFSRAVNRSEIPVFIIGMPRSGTSLVEQIVAAHPSVYGAGELPFIPKLVRDLPKNLKTERPYPGCMPAMTPKVMDALAQFYLGRLRRISKTARQITDKMPQNFFHLGIISLMFPKSRVIHCTRNPMDTALSIYFQNFSGGLAFAFNLDDIVAYYRQYQRLMSHWKRVLKIPVMEVRYEELVGRQEKISRDIIAFLGLTWDNRCLNFHQIRRDVGTASFQQVREPIFHNSVGRWRNYEPHIGLLIDSFKEYHAWQ